MAYKSKGGSIYKIGKEIGRGGEGSVFEIDGHNALVVKIYNEPLDRAKIEKLIFMSTFKNADVNRYAAWPLDVVTDENGNVCGFVMNKLNGYVPLHMLFSPIDRKKLFPDKGYNFLIHVARNLSVAFHFLHSNGIVVGDINEANILVNAQGMLTLIDCDSFQVYNGGKYYYCEVGIPRYTPPELLEHGTFNTVVRTINTDSFSVATLIFQILFLGRAPFTGINPSIRDDFDEDAAIIQGEFAYSLRKANKKLLPAKNSLDFSKFPNGLIDLFHRAFENRNNRPTPSNWVQQLDFVLNNELTHCNKEKSHYHFKSQTSCPWCAFKNRGVMYFFDDSYLQDVQEFGNIQDFIHGYKIELIPHKALSNDYRTGNFVAAEISMEFRKLRTVQRFRIFVFLVLLVASFFIHWSMVFVIVIAAVLIASKSKMSQKINEELSERKNKYESCKSVFENTIHRYNDVSQLKKYNLLVKGVSVLVECYKDLPNEYAKSRKKIEEQNYFTQLENYLRRFAIKDHSIQSFGSAKKMSLYNQGITTAADIHKLNSIKVPGIGPKNIQILQNWQRLMTSNFTYLPDNNLLKSQFDTLVIAMSDKKKQIESKIKNEWAQANILKNDILKFRDRVENGHAAIKGELYQAELDYYSFKKFFSIR